MREEPRQAVCRVAPVPRGARIDSLFLGARVGLPSHGVDKMIWAESWLFWPRWFATCMTYLISRFPPIKRSRVQYRTVEVCAPERA